MRLLETSRRNPRLKSIAEFWDRYKERSPSVFGLAVVILVIMISLAAPLISPYDPNATRSAYLAPPSADHLMGTDGLGRDILSRLIWGSRIALMLAFGAAGFSLMIGMVVGAIPGYYGGVVDEVLSRFFDVFLTIPRIFLIILIIAIFGNSIYFVMLVLALTYWPSNARIARAQTLSLKKRAFVEASRVSGAADMDVIFRHILPNSVHSLVANSIAFMARAIITEAGLSYLGLGDVSQVTWGQILYDSRLTIGTSIWPALFSGLAIAILVSAFYLVGNGVNYAMNPRLRQR